MTELPETWTERCRWTGGVNNGTMVVEVESWHFGLIEVGVGDTWDEALADAAKRAEAVSTPEQRRHNIVRNEEAARTRLADAQEAWEQAKREWEEAKAEVFKWQGIRIAHDIDHGKP